MKNIFLSILLLIAVLVQGQHSLGLEDDETAYDAIPLKANLTRSLYDGINLPTSTSLKNYCPPVGNQQFNDCVGWANSYGARSILFNQKYKRTGDKVAVFSPTYLHRSVATDCQSLAVTEKALGFLKEVGTLPNQLIQYGCMENIPADSLKTLAAAFRITEYEKLFSKDEQNAKTKILKIKKALAEGNPVIIGMDIYKSFMTADGQTVWNPILGDEKMGGHAMVVVAYDDTKDGGAFEVMNSWGNDWGKNGFIWVRYGHFATHVKRAYTMTIDNTIKNEEEVYDGMIKPSMVNDSLAKLKTDSPIYVPAVVSIPVILHDDTSHSVFAGRVRLITTDSIEIPLENIIKEQEGINVQSGEMANIIHSQIHPFYCSQKSYQNGTGFRIYVQNKQTAYVYVLGLDIDGALSCLFPYEEGLSALLDYRNSEIALPDEDQFIELQNPIGDEWMCVIYAKSKLNIENVLTGVGKESGNLLERIEKAFGEHCVSPNHIQYDENTPAFKANMTAKEIVPLAIKIKHTK